MPKPDWDHQVSVLSKDWDTYGNDAKKPLLQDGIHGVSLSEAPENEGIQRICPYPEAKQKADAGQEVHKVSYRQEQEGTGV